MGWTFTTCLSLMLLYTVGAQRPHLYPYGEEVGDSIAPINDDGYTERVDISIGFPFFNTTYSSLFVSIYKCTYSCK